MKKLVITSFVLFSSIALAKNLVDYNPYKYEVLFTNPTCQEYRYPTPVASNNGTLLIAKPKNVYCKNQDIEQTLLRNDVPENRLIEWIKADNTHEIFMAYLSFSNKRVTEALCESLKKGTLLNLVVDADPEEDKGNASAEELKKCGDINVHYRGNRNGLGFAHNKITIINPHDPLTFQMVFSSGNMSTGTVIHHENWHFLTTSPQSYLAQAHLCLKENLIDHGDSKKDFVSNMKNCLGQISTEEESDIKVFFVPGQGKEAFNALATYARGAEKIQSMAHRFSGIFVALFSELAEAKKEINLILDDDMYWSYKLHKDVGRNSRMEAFKAIPLKNIGVKLRFLETNQNQVFLQHNKYMIFSMPNHEDVVFTGAGNFTSSAFENNFENFYIIKIPKVVAQFKTQYDLMWNVLSTSEEMLPSQMIMP